MTAGLAATETQRPFVAFLTAARGAGLDVAVMRDTPDLISGLEELDLLVRPGDLDAACRLAEQLGWMLQDTGVFLPGKRALVLYQARRLLKIDLHAAFIDYALVYMASEPAWARAEAGPCGALYLAAADWWLHVVLHVILGKDKLPEKYRARLGTLDSQMPDRAQVMAAARAFGLDAIVEPLLGNAVATLSDPARLMALKRQVRTRLRRHPANLAREMALWLMWGPGRLLGLRRGFSIAFIGPDGAGKSTTIQAFARLFADMQIPVRCAYMGPWEQGRLPTSAVLRRFGATPLDETVPAQFHGMTRLLKRGKAWVKRYAWYLHVLPDMWERHLRMVLPHLLLRRTVLLDRYVHDLLVGYYNNPVDNSLALRRLICALLPSPNFVVLLDNDPETIWQRKQEYQLPVIATALAAYRGVAQRYGFEPVRTDRSADCIAEDFVARHWRVMIALRRDRLLPWR